MASNKVIKHFLPEPLLLYSQEKQILSDLALEVSHTNKGYLADWEHGGARTLSDLSSLDSRSSGANDDHHHHHHHHHHHNLSGSQTQLHKVHLDNNHHHHHNLLSKRDNQMRHGAGAAGEEVHGGGEGRGHPYDSEMASRVTNQRHNQSPSPMRRSKSLNLRTPFYFDKEDYYSDGGSTWHAVEEKKDAQSKKVKDKEKKQRSSRKSVSRSGSSAIYSGEPIRLYEDKPKARKKKEKKSKKKKGSSGREDRSDDGYESPPIDYEDFSPVRAGTIDRAAGTNGNSVPLHVATSYEPRSPTIYLTPPGPEVSTAFPHIPQKAMTEDSSTSPTGTSSTGYESKNLVSNKAPVGSRDIPRQDALYAKPHKTKSENAETKSDNFVIETTPTERGGLAARRDSSPLVLHTVQPRQAAAQAQDHYDNSSNHVNSHNNIQGANHYLNSSLARQPRGSKSTTTMEETVIETTPEVNTMLPDMNRGSPTRRSALKARHPDGSPFLLHTADSKQVEKQLREHPEDGADVLDHVISFRCYDSPVPREDLRLFNRNSMRRSGKSRKSGRSSQT
ncbi:hypothetical protein PoB_004073400 [Plakobranchus ocellatus]|uniref:Uncharacterized protein n=1 Tax=Plakobranchus ocellatus TaxID=259542 RepID=A0AAV4B6B7_9GAST|nr:hypothetical protein PoB_004073400 [Plakobranchus ocellatus]